MTNTIHNHSTLSKFSELLFVRQTPQVAAEQHPSLLQSLIAWRTRRAAKTELTNMSDRELADIGVRRQDIPAVVAKGK